MLWKIYSIVAAAIFCLTLCAVRDILQKQIYISEIIAFALINLILAWYEKIGWGAMVFGVLPGIVLFLVSVCSREKMGKGDAFLVMGAGIYLGIVKIFLVVFAALLLSSVYGLFLLWKKKGWAYEIAFVPFLLVPYTGAVILSFFS